MYQPCMADLPKNGDSHEPPFLMSVRDLFILRAYLIDYRSFRRAGSGVDRYGSL